MTTSNTIAEQWTAYADELPIDIAEADLLRVRRAFYAGAIATLLIAKRGAKAADVMAELQHYGRQVGTAHELRA
jgi:hypothetical protein